VCRTMGEETTMIKGFGCVQVCCALCFVDGGRWGRKMEVLDEPAEFFF